MVDHPGSSHREYEQLARYWDAITTSHPADAAVLDPDLVAAVQAFHRLGMGDGAQRPDPNFVHRLLEDLMATATTISPEFVTPNVVPTRSPNGRAPAAPVWERLPPRRVPWAGGALVTAVLVLLTLIGGFFAIGSHRLGREAGAPIIMPAFVGTPEASPVPAGVATPSAAISLLKLKATGLSCPGPCAQLIRTRIAPGGFTQESSTGPDSELFYVESGTITTRLLKGDHPAVNLGSGLEAAPQAATPTASGEVTIATGQAGWITPGTTIEVRNDGDAPASVIWLIEGAGTGQTRNLEWESLSPNAPGDIPPSPILITLDRLTLAPNAAITPAPAPVIMVAGPVDPLTGYLVSSRDGYRNIGTSPLDVYLLTIQPQGTPASTSTTGVGMVTPAAATATTPAASSEFASEPLLQVTLPGDVISQPTKGSNIWLFSDYSMEPGTHADYGKDCAAPDFVVRYVLNGTYDVRPTGPLEVIRDAAAGASATSEKIAPGQEVELHTGDALVYHDTTGDDYAGFRNPGPDRLELLEWQWLEDDCLIAIPLGIDLQWDLWTRGTPGSADLLPFDPARPFTLRFRRMTAAPGTELPQDGPNGPGFLPPGAPGLEVAGAETGTVEVSEPSVKEALLVVADTMRPPGGIVSEGSYLPVGAPRTIRSTGDEPLLLYTLTIVNTNANAPAAATPVAGARTVTP